MTKTYKPTTPSLRHTILPGTDELTRPSTNKPCKALLVKKRSAIGRNNKGHITSRRCGGGGHKRMIRVIDFKRNKDDIPAKIVAVEYDPNRSAHIALLAYADGEKRYMLAVKGMKAGDTILCGNSDVPIRSGNSMPLKVMPIGSTICNIELYPGRGGQMIRSAGSSAQLMARSEGYATLKMPSGEVRMVPDLCRATLGVLSNAEHNLTVIGKAGRNRWLGRRPVTRGIVRNPVDHPLGGGEGKAKSDHPQSPTAMLSKGFRTRCKKKSTKLIVKDRRKK